MIHSQRVLLIPYVTVRLRYTWGRVAGRWGRYCIGNWRRAAIKIGGYELTALFCWEHDQTRMRGMMMVPEGYRRYARSEGLDPYSYFQMVNQPQALVHNERIEYAGTGFGPSWKALWRFFSTLGTGK